MRSFALSRLGGSWFLHRKDRILLILVKGSLQSKCFRASSSGKLGREQKKKIDWKRLLRRLGQGLSVCWVVQTGLKITQDSAKFEFGNSNVY